MQAILPVQALIWVNFMGPLDIVNHLLNFVAPAAAMALLLVGLWITGRDGKMLTYGALVLACATSHAVGQRLWRK